MRAFLFFLVLPFLVQAGDFRKISSKEDLKVLFPSTLEELEKLKEKTRADFLLDIEKIVTIPKEKRNFENTALALDQVQEKVSIAYSLISALSYLSPDEQIQDLARKSQLEIDQMLIEQFTDNRRLYYAVKDYLDKEKPLLPYQKNYLDDLMKSFEEQGHLLPSDERKEVKALLQQIVSLEETFDQNIQSDRSFLDVERSALVGLGEDFLSALQQTEGGKTRLYCDYPTYFSVIDYCENEKTRKDFYHVFMNRAYPKNEAILLQLIEKRNRYAQKLGYPSYAHLSLRKEMAISPKAVEIFLNDLSSQLSFKEEKEFEAFQKEPVFFSLKNKSGHINPWDFRYMENVYLKSRFYIDHQQIAEYFPLPYVLNKMGEIFGQFFDVTILSEYPTGLWSSDLVSLKIIDNQDQSVLGYILMDLFPRPNKYSHACMMEVLPSKKGDYPSLKMIIANFPKPQNDKPSLMQLDQVRTLFHEFGHAMHAILARTDLFAQSGTHVKTDFVEMPSQLLEEWTYDENVLKKISSHYKTQETLPEPIIEKIILSRYATAGFFYGRQTCLSFLSLCYFSGDPVLNIEDLYLKLNSIHRPHISLDPQDHFPCSFGHLTGYGAKYYSYIWTRLMAADIFSEIKKHNMDSSIGKRYRLTILEKGGTVSPKKLMEDFLEREPTQKAFLKTLQERRQETVENSTGE